MAVPHNMLSSYAVQGKIGGGWAGVARPTTSILPRPA